MTNAIEGSRNEGEREKTTTGITCRSLILTAVNC